MYFQGKCNFKAITRLPAPPLCQKPVWLCLTQLMLPCIPLSYLNLLPGEAILPHPWESSQLLLIPNQSLWHQESCSRQVTCSVVCSACFLPYSSLRRQQKTVLY